MVEIKLSFPSIDDAINFLQGGAHNNAVAKAAGEPVDITPLAAVPVQDAPVMVERKKPGRKPKTESVVAMPDAQPEVAENTGSEASDSSLPSEGFAVADQPVAAESAVAPAGNVTADQVRDALKNLAASKGIGAVSEILSKFQVARVSELREEQFAAVLEAVQ